MLLSWNIFTKLRPSVLIGLAMAVVYFFLFVFVIKKFYLKTPGREDDDETDGFGRLADGLGFDGLPSSSRRRGSPEVWHDWLKPTVCAGA